MFRPLKGHHQAFYLKQVFKILLFFFNRHCNPCGFWHAQLLLSILSRKVFTECRCQRHVKPPQLGGSVIRTFQLSPQGVPSVWNDASELQQRKVQLCVRNCREFCRKWRLPRHFWGLLRAVNLRNGSDGFYFPSEGRLAEDFFARTRELGYQRPERSPLDHRSHFLQNTAYLNVRSILKTCFK